MKSPETSLINTQTSAKEVLKTLDKKLFDLIKPRNMMKFPNLD